MIRSVLAVLAGIVVLTATSFAVEAVANPLLMRMFPHALPNEAALNQSLPAKLFMLLYTALCVAAGGYVTAWVARRFPVGHAVAMGVVQLALTVWAMIALAHRAPLWSWIVGMVMIVPAAWCGGMLRLRHARTET